MAKQYIYFNGKFVPEEEAKVSVRTHALQYGTGIFEGIRAYYNEKEKMLMVFRMREHYERMMQSAKILMLKVPHSVDELCELTIELLKKNYSETDIYIRPFAYKSQETVSSFNLQTLENGFTIYTVSMGRYLNTEAGIKANISSWMRTQDNAIPPRAKISGSYVNTALAKTESELNGYSEALMLDVNGHIVEGSAENIFIVKDGELYTPPTADDILKGITRDTVMVMARELKIPVKEKSIDRTEIYQADEVFLVGTGAEVAAVTEVDKRPIGNGEIGLQTRLFKEMYYKMTHGELEKYRNYVTKVAK